MRFNQTPRIRYFSLLLFLAFCFILLVTCRHKADLTLAPPPPAPTPNPPGYSCSPDTIYFQNAVLPLIVSNCAKSGCHDQATGQHGLVLDSYSTIIHNVSPFNPQGSRLYTALFNGEEDAMPPGSPFSANQKSIIYYWIAQGALNNKCTEAGCDSSNVTFDSVIKPILQTWCVGCHSGSSPSNGLSLTTYAQIVASVNSGRLMGAIRQDVGYHAMPPGSKLSDCSIAIFQKWINLGEPQ
ncbi:MAG: hypothetical protein NTX61_12690 [Bacteroidetes bacterium]|nr:hypothetical protein [Bacteroidota bacterium]